MKTIKITNDVFFLIFLYLNVFCKGIGLDNNNNIYFILLIFGSICLLIKIISDKYTKKEVGKIAIFLLIGLFSFIFTRKVTLLITCICLSGMKNIMTDKIFKGMLNIRLLTFFSIILLSLLNIIDNLSIAMWRNGTLDVRYSLGFGHPNSLHLALFILISLYLYCKYEKIKFIEYIFLLALNLFIYKYSGSRTGFILSILLIVLTLLSENKKIKSILLKLPIPLLLSIVIFSFSTALLYNKIGLINKLNDILNGRIAYSNYYLTHYGLSLFGKNILNDKNALFDNGYIFLYIQYGIIGVLLILYILLAVCKKIKRDNDIKKNVLVIVYVIYGFTESFTPNIFMNIILLFYSDILFKERSELTYEKKC